MLYFCNAISWLTGFALLISKILFMYISNLLHFLDEKGNIPGEMPREAREMAHFLALVVDSTTGMMNNKYSATGIRCFERG